MSEYESEPSEPVRSYLFDSTFDSDNAAYVFLNLNLDNQGQPRKYTPFQSLSDFNEILFEDNKSRESFISTKCKKCECYIGLNELGDHVTLHTSLKTLSFKDMPKHMDELIKRRRLLIKANSITNIAHASELQDMKILEWDQRVKKINDAYEIVKGHLDGSFYSINKIRKTLAADTKVESIITINPAITTIGMCVNQNKDKRKQMEDTNIIIESFGQNSNKTYIGLFDGYDGDVSSLFCSKQLHLALLKNISKFDKTVNYIKTDDALDDEINNMVKFEVNKGESPPESRSGAYELSNQDNEVDDQLKAYLNNIKTAFHNSYRQMDKLLSRGRHEKSKTRWSGATSATCIIEKIENNKTWLHMANCGDVEALLVMNYKNKQNAPSRKYKLLTNMHTIKRNPKERERLEKENCKIIETPTEAPKIEGLYEITRAFGFHGDVDVKKFITHVPSVRSIELDENCACIVLATKGIWKFLDYETVSELVLQMLPSSNIISSTITHDVNVKNLIKMSNKNKNDKQEDEKPPTPEYIQQFLEISRSTLETKDEHNFKESEVEAILNKSLNDDKNSITKSLFDDEDQHSRPHTLPDEYLNKDLKTNYDESFKVYSATKSNSDIFPLNRGTTSATKKQNDEIRYNEQPMTIEDYTKHLLSSMNKNSNSILSKMSAEVELFAQDLIKNTSNEITQVSTNDIEREFRKYLDKAVRYKYDITEEISKRLVNSALHAGSDENIFVNCVMLPASLI